MDKLIPKFTGHIRFLGSSLKVIIIINQDKNVTQRMKPTALFNLSFLYRWFSWNATSDSQVLHILGDKSHFTCITGFTDHIPILGTFHASCAKFGPNHVSCILKPFATLFLVGRSGKNVCKVSTRHKKENPDHRVTALLIPWSGRWKLWVLAYLPPTREQKWSEHEVKGPSCPGWCLGVSHDWSFIWRI